MGGPGAGGRSDSIRIALETYKTKGEDSLSDYHKELIKWLRNVDQRYAWVVVFALWIIFACTLGPYRVYGLIFAKVTEE